MQSRHYPDDVTILILDSVYIQSSVRGLQVSSGAALQQPLQATTDQESLLTGQVTATGCSKRPCSTWRSKSGHKNQIFMFMLENSIGGRQCQPDCTTFSQRLQVELRLRLHDLKQAIAHVAKTFVCSIHRRAGLHKLSGPQAGSWALQSARPPQSELAGQ
jgi:hypothetical protein